MNRQTTAQSSKTTKQLRRDRWRYLPLSLVAQLPEDVLALILAAVYEDGKDHFVQTRYTSLKHHSHTKLSDGVASLLTVMVVLVGALSLSLVPYAIARESGRSGPLAIAIGFVSGGAASYFAHAAASHYLCDRRMKELTEEQQRSLS